MGYGQSKEKNFRPPARIRAPPRRIMPPQPQVAPTLRASLSMPHLAFCPAAKHFVKNTARDFERLQEQNEKHLRRPLTPGSLPLSARRLIIANNS